MEFTQEVKDKWLEAIESGKYVHGKYSLKETIDGISRHCALGVLCECYPEVFPMKDKLFIPEYRLFEAMFGNKTWDVSLASDNQNDYSEVIEVIKKLPING